MPLATCPECSRHVKVTESRCPFCESELPRDLAGRVLYRPPHPGRFGRAALVTFGAALTAASSLGCSSDSDDTRDDKYGQGEAGTTGTGGGATATDAGALGGSGGAAGASTGGFGGDVSQPVYGIPVEAGDPNIGQPEYGVPIDFDAGDPGAINPVDGGDGDDMGAQPVYGLPADSND
jgi:hypothetical protein